MSDKYILRSGAIDAIKRNRGTLYTRDAEFLFRKVISLLKNVPAADVVEVVHCKDCKYRRKNGENEWYCVAIDGLSDPWDDEFCSYGKRRGNGRNSGD